MVRHKNTEISEVLQGLKCCSSPDGACSECPFRKYKYTCQVDLLYSAYILLKDTYDGETDGKKGT